MDRAKPILLLGHLDTVWPLGTLGSMPCRVRDGRLWGPGTLDMKAGVAMASTAIELLMEADLLRHEIILLLNSDEEIGSPVSRPITENLAQQCAAVYVLEPAQGLAYKTARKGVGDWHIQVQGVAAHAGVDFEKGANALRELARVIETVSGWTDLNRGLTVSVGMATGGSKSNVVPARAWAHFDVRIPRLADAARITRKFAALRPTDPRCTLEVPAKSTVRPWSAAAEPCGSTAKRTCWPANSASISTKPPPAADRMGILPRRWAFPRSTAWARWAKARTRGTNRSSLSIWRRAPRCSPACCFGERMRG